MTCLCCTAPTGLPPDRLVAGTVAMMLHRDMDLVVELLCPDHAVQIAEMIAAMEARDVAPESPPKGHAA